MKGNAKILLFSLLVGSISWSCDKDKVTPTTIVQAKCVIQSETYGLSSNEKSFGYEYDANGDLTNVNIYRPNGSVSGNYAIGSNTIVNQWTYGNKPASEQQRYSSSSLTGEELPSDAYVTLTNEFDGTVYIDYAHYHFLYNNEKQLILVQTRNGPHKGGHEYDINFNYNAQGNVTSIKYIIFTGPNEDVPLVTVTGFDDKPNPHAGIKGWRFFLINNFWENPDPGPVIAALSQNNPLGFSSGAGQTLFDRKIEYDYNADGFPTTQKNTNKNAGGEYTFYQTYTYVCK